MMLIWTLLTFLLGSLPFSVWVGKLGLHKEIRDYGDQNPGATNVLRAGGLPWFVLALALDVSKAAVPVGLAYQIFGWHGWEIVPIALAAPFGHAFSPFLQWRGGKAVATLLGVWIGLTLWVVPLLGISLLVLLVLTLTPHGWTVLFTLLTVAVFVGVWLQNPILLAVAIGHIALMAWTHRDDLQQWPRLRWRKK
jgi:glycerol-3-phosphate acyltransferase PlsY